MLSSSERKGVVIKVSGSLLSPPSQEYLSRLRSSVEELVRAGIGVAVVTGGGRTAREYIVALRAMGVSESLLDMLGIEASRLNALAVATAFYPLSPPRVPTTVEEAVELWLKGLVPVMGGLQPGQSTNAVAAVIAESLGAKLIVNLLNGVDGVYDRDPREPGARRIPRLSYADLETIVSGKSSEAGTYELFDKVALEVIKRSSIRVIFIDGRNPENLIRVITKGEDIGSIVGP